MRFSELLSRLTQVTVSSQRDLAGDPGIQGADSLDRAGPGQLCFLEEGNALARQLLTSKASAVLIPSGSSEASQLQIQASERGIAWVSLENPRLGFAEALEILYPRHLPPAGIEPSASVSIDAHVGNGCSIGAQAVIGPGSRLGERCIIHPGAVLLGHVQLDDDCEVHPNAVIHPGSRLGRACVIHSTAVVGSEGFGFIPTPQGWFKMPQTGIVVLEERVEVGCGSTIDRPCVGETRIGAGTKLDNQVHIGHNVTIGCDCVMAAQVGIAGGARIGNNVVLAGQVGVANGALIGENVTATSKSGLHGTVTAGSILSGYPAIEHMLWLRCVAAFSRLPLLLRSTKQAAGRLSD